MKTRIQFRFMYETMIVLILLGILVTYSKGLSKSEVKNNNVSLSYDSLYINDCERILNYRCGVDIVGQKRMILSAAAEYCYKESYSSNDSVLSVVNVVYIEDYKDHELYWVRQGSPFDFHFNERITDIDCMGDYVTIYSIKGRPTITYDIIQQMGFNDKTDYFTCHEFSWFILIDPKTARHILVKNALDISECKSSFDVFLNNKEQNCKIATLMASD